MRRNARKVGSAVAVSAILLAAGTAAATPALGAVPTCDGKAATIVGTSHADRIVGTPRADVIVAGAGSDRVVGRGGADLICGGAGDDHLHGGNGPDHVFGGPGKDVLSEGAGSPYIDVLRGGSGDDLLRSIGLISGSSTRRTLVGGAGADRIVSSGDSDRLRGGAGDDHLVALARVWNMSGGGGQDILRVSRSGGATLRLRGDGDSVRIERSNSPITFFVRFNYIEAPGPVMVDLQAGYGQVVGSTVKDEFLGLTDQPGSYFFLRGTNGNDILLGTDRTGTTEDLDGRRGDDELRGRGGPDSLWGKSGDDILDGGPGSDRGSGGSGTDTCIDIEELLDC